MSDESVYTAISFAPVQGFIEKSRKLRDLYGASQILSYLSQQLAESAAVSPGLEVISPALIHVQKGMPNRILIKGSFERNDVQKTLIEAWDKILTTCRAWIEKNVPASDHYYWDAEWIRWRQYTWEIFWGHGKSPDAAMRDLEQRKLKRDWTAINWTGESSSLTGTDAIAWTGLGKERDPKYAFCESEKKELKQFYQQLAWVLDDPYQRAGRLIPAGVEPEGKYISASEKLSLPEVVKRLVTLPKLAKQIGMEELQEGFKDVVRDPGFWTGWFMGDGDKVGDKLKQLNSDQERQSFSQAMRKWGQQFQAEFPEALGRVIYAGGDDFLGVLYRDNPKHKPELFKVKAISWLMQLNSQWKQHGQDITLSTGFVWAGHSVPQRDILQHCREAEKRSKNLGRNRLTLRVVFNSGQYVQWTCPWDTLDILTRYRDREGGKNWTHLYSDWSQLKARHAIRFKEVGKNPIDAQLALALLNLYFDDAEKYIQQKRHANQTGWTYVAGNNTDPAIVQWIDDLIQVGWQLCSNT